MRNQCMKVCFVLGIISFFLTGCPSSEDAPGPTGPTYQELISQAWTAFSQGQYQDAANSFTEAKSTNANEAEAYVGLGWSLLKLDNLAQANTEFNSGSTKNNPSADLYAGWAFVLNAQKDYANSNTQAAQALTVDPNWSFAYGLPLDMGDLHVLKAENYFLLGSFSESLVEVQILNPGFSVDVSTSEGQSALAAEIERLRGTT